MTKTESNTETKHSVYDSYQLGKLNGDQAYLFQVTFVHSYYQTIQASFIKKKDIIIIQPDSLKFNLENQLSLFQKKH